MCRISIIFTPVFHAEKRFLCSIVGRRAVSMKLHYLPSTSVLSLPTCSVPTSSTDEEDDNGGDEQHNDNNDRDDDGHALT